MTDRLEPGPPDLLETEGPPGGGRDEPGAGAGDDLLAAERAGEIRRAAQREHSAAARRARVSAVAPWVVVAALAIGAVVAGVAGVTGAIVPTSGVTEKPGAMPVIRTVIPSVDATPGGAIGVAVSGDRVYVAESRKGLVRVTTREGSAVATIGAGWLVTPVYVAVGPVDGRVYVSDRGRGEVGVFAATGEFIGVITPGGPSDETTAGAWHPLALGFGPEGSLYVADSSVPQSIAVFSPVGSLVGTLGAGVPAGRTGQAFAFPNGIAVDADEVVVADSNNGRLLVFDRSGAFLREIAVEGLPRAVALLGDGRIVMTDAASDEVSVLDSKGHVLGTVTGAEGGPAERPVVPAGAAVGENGALYVADSMTGQVFVAGEAALDVERQRPLSAPSRTGLIVLSLLLFAAAGVLGRRATVRARARVRAGGVTL